MNLYKNKKAVSQIIATVLVIMVTVSVVVILWATITPLITGKFEEAAECRIATSAMSLTDVCLIGGTELSFKISRNSQEFDLTDLQIIIMDEDGNSDSVIYTEIQDFTVSNLPNPNNGIAITRNFNSTYINLAGTFYSFEIAPIIQLGSQNITCSSINRKKVDFC